MTMHLLPAYYNTNGNSKRKRKDKNKITEHDKWLEKNGLSLSQIKKKKSVDLSWKKKYNEDMAVERSTKHYDQKQFVAGSTAKNDIMSNLHKEPKHVQDAVLEKASRVMPLYNKGGLQLLSPRDDLKSVGTLSRR
jgi:hypothetical protein